MSTTLLRIPTERADQLKAVAAHKSVSVSDLIGELVTVEAKRLAITDSLGIGGSADASKLEDGTIALSAARLGNFQWKVAVATFVAETIEALANRKKASNVFDVDAGVEIARVGPSIRLRNIHTGEARTFAPSVALDLARLIREAIAE
ncbi:hypothetical protein [Nitratireductor luteus]|uniref:hypothetical protein n=1 Tax=Nitratireductor luteus TaxID=2976980 RepID=UPI0022407148|nr:hypothetical protein [Nitratireductor luteus]